MYCFHGSLKEDSLSSVHLGLFPCKVSVHLKFWMNLILFSCVVPSRETIKPVSHKPVFHKQKQFVRSKAKKTKKKIKQVKCNVRGNVRSSSCPEKLINWTKNWWSTEGGWELLVYFKKSWFIKHLRRVKLGILFLSFFFTKKCYFSINLVGLLGKKYK